MKPSLQVLAFSVAGRPVPTARPRVLKTGWTYTPKSTIDGQRMVAEAALVATNGIRPLFAGCALSVVIEACFRHPQRTAKKRIPAGWTPMVQMPDVDNLAKTVLDACHGIVWTDDNQVAELVIRKWRVPNEADEGFHVEVREIT